MKEIDLIPEWYKVSKRKQRSLRSQYIILAGVLAIMVVWNFINANSLSNAKAGYQNKKQLLEQSEDIIRKADEIQNEIKALEGKSDLLNSIDSNINIAAIISELSFLTNEKIVLSELKFTAEKFSGIKRNQSGPSGIRVAQGGSKSKEAVSIGDVRFKGLIRGIADETAEVGAFVRRLEDSNYFQSVSLAFSRTGNIKLQYEDKADERQVSQFEISCYLANYKMTQK
ncbi:MAG: PilN domain-containing protein [Sedimentisphaerales bacterium]|nr:PilN domain-containing protein [Sedimentisphaerales bacterium]